MPGHTKGSTSWMLAVRDGGRKYDVLFFSSTSSPDFKFIDNPGFPNLIEAFESTFARLKKLKPDVFLASHGSAFDLTGKIARRGDGKPNPFIESASYFEYLKDSEADFRAKVEKERQAK
jgi:metallo-beta-lactamase class B